jgi:putative transposase
LVTDTEGFLVEVQVVSGNTPERAALREVVTPGLKERCPRIEDILVDSGFQGKEMEAYVKEQTGATMTVAKHATEGADCTWEPKEGPAQQRVGFQILPMRWVVERTYGWMNRQRRLSKEYEYLCSTSRTLILAAMGRLMVRRYVHPIQR